MFNYNLIDKPDIELNIEIIDTIFKKISNIIDIKHYWTLNIVFVNSESIKNLNNDYRKIDKVTDVLSFHYFEDFSELKDDDIAWEIIMCLDKIKIQALEYLLWEEKEFYKLLIHSILHILWYDHEKDNDYTIMSWFEKIIWQEVFEK